LLLSRTEHGFFGYPVSSLVAVPITPFQSMNLAFKGKTENGRR